MKGLVGILIQKYAAISMINYCMIGIFKIAEPNPKGFQRNLSTSGEYGRRGGAGVH